MICMANENGSKWQKLETSLSGGLPKVIKFFTNSTGLEVAVLHNRQVEQASIQHTSL